MQSQIKLCAWELYLKNLSDIYPRAALYFGIRFGVLFLFSQIVPVSFLIVVQILLALALTPLEFWWYQSLLDTIKEEKSPIRYFLLFYYKEQLCRKALAFQLLSQGLVLWIWGVGKGFSVGSNGNTLAFVTFLFILLQCLVPFFVAIFVQPFFVNLLLSPGTAFDKQLVFSWRLMRGNRKELLQLWLSLLCWIILMVLPGVFLPMSGHPFVFFIFCAIRWLACTVAAPYVALASALFSLRLLR